MRFPPVLIKTCALFLLLNSAVIYLAYINGLRLLPLEFLFLLAGLLFESIRITRNVKIVAIITMVSYILSFASFIPFKNENNYIYQNHFEIWPYVFLFLFIIGGLVTWGNKTVTGLTEGITLIQSMAIIYYILTFENIFQIHLAFQIIILIFLLTSLLPFYHAFTNKNLSVSNRLMLSIYSSVIMLIFAIDNSIKVLSGVIANEGFNSFRILNAINYFLLGISVIYFIQNFLMLINYFLPEKGGYRGKAHLEKISLLNEKHIARYSDSQVKIIHSVFCVIISGLLFSINYVYKFVAPLTAIWCVFLLVPMLIHLIQGNKKRQPEQTAF